MNAIIYSTARCGYCVAAKRKLAALNIDYQEIDIASNAEAFAEMRQKTGRTSVPQIFIDDVHVGGFTDLIQALKNGNITY
ncbi:MAG: glutaredoxin domain-containing protein [Pseudohongiellaceae bacterium]